MKCAEQTRDVAAHGAQCPDNADRNETGDEGVLDGGRTAPAFEKSSQLGPHEQDSR